MQRKYCDARSDTPAKGKGMTSPAAAHFAELRSFRRGWMTWRAPGDSLRNEAIMTEGFFFSVGLCRRLIKEHCVKNKYSHITK